MNTIKKRSRKKVARVFTLLPILLLAILAVPFSVAKGKPSDYGVQRVSVIAHLPISGTPVTQMFVQEQGGKEYLYMQQTSQPGYTIIDVSRANRPKVVKRDAFQNRNSGEKLQMMSGGIALSETPASVATGSIRHELAPLKTPGSVTGASNQQSVRVLDMSDPANPRTLQTFEGVTGVLADDSRSLIYIVNGDGLWILRHTQGRPPLPKCDSESVFSPIADCQ
jgi:hypothetical protein